MNELTNFEDSLNNKSLTLRNLVVVLIVVAGVTGGNLWLHRNDTPLGLNRFSNFGFTFDHGSEGYVEIGSILGETPSYSEGSYTVSFESEGALQYGVFWFTTEDISISDDVLGSSLDTLFMLAGQGGTQLSRDNDQSYSEKNGHEMIYEYFEVNESGVDIPGVIGVWECDDRVFLFYTVYIEDVENPIKDNTKLTEIWNQNLKNFQCN